MRLPSPAPLVLLALSCRAEAPPSPPAPLASGSPHVEADAAARVSPTAVPPRGPDLVPVPAPPPVARAQIALVSPKSGETLEPTSAADAPLDIAVEGIDGAKVRPYLVLDDFPAIRVGAEPPTRLGALVPEDASLGRGAHRLVAVLVHENGALVRGEDGVIHAATTFSVGESSSVPDGPRLVYILPQGTYNGAEAAKRVVLSFFARGAGPNTTVGVVVEGVGTRTEAQVPVAMAHTLAGLSSGDYRVSLSLGERVVARTITVNLDAPVSD